jgi:hypothetical protein
MAWGQLEHCLLFRKRQIVNVGALAQFDPMVFADRTATVFRTEDQAEATRNALTNSGNDLRKKCWLNSSLRLSKTPREP